MMMQSYEIDQSCATEANWADPITNHVTRQETLKNNNEGVKVVQSSYRPKSQISSENENVHIDSMISFDCRPVIQANYNIVEMP